MLDQNLTANKLLIAIVNLGEDPILEDLLEVNNVFWRNYEAYKNDGNLPELEKALGEKYDRMSVRLIGKLQGASSPENFSQSLQTYLYFLKVTNLKRDLSQLFDFIMYKVKPARNDDQVLLLRHIIDHDPGLTDFLHREYNLLWIAIHLRDKKSIVELLHRGAALGEAPDWVKKILDEDPKIKNLVNANIFKPDKVFEFAIENKKYVVPYENVVKNISLLGAGEYGQVFRLELDLNNLEEPAKKYLKDRVSVTIDASGNEHYWVACKLPNVIDADFAREMKIAELIGNEKEVQSTSYNYNFNVDLKIGTETTQHVIFSYLECYGAEENGEPLATNSKDFYTAQVLKFRGTPSELNIVSHQMLYTVFTAYETLADLHEDGVIHSDVALRNILLGRLLSGVISDYGKAVIAEVNQRVDVPLTADERLPLRWLDPIRLSSQNHNISVVSDLYSFRILILEMMAAYLNKPIEFILQPPNYDPKQNLLQSTLAFVMNNKADPKKIFEHFIKNVNDMVKQESNIAVRNEVNAMLETFEDYLLSCPLTPTKEISADVAKEIIGQTRITDMTMFNDSLTNYYKNALIKATMNYNRTGDLTGLKDQLITLNPIALRLAVKDQAEIKSLTQICDNIVENIDKNDVHKVTESIQQIIPIVQSTIDHDFEAKYEKFYNEFKTALANINKIKDLYGQLDWQGFSEDFTPTYFISLFKELEDDLSTIEKDRLIYQAKVEAFKNEYDANALLLAEYLQEKTKAKNNESQYLKEQIINLKNGEYTTLKTQASETLTKGGAANKNFNRVHYARALALSMRMQNMLDRLNHFPSEETTEFQNEQRKSLMNDTTTIWSKIPNKKGEKYKRIWKEYLTNQPDLVALKTMADFSIDINRILISSYKLQMLTDNLEALNYDHFPNLQNLIDKPIDDTKLSIEKIKIDDFIADINLLKAALDKALPNLNKFGIKNNKLTISNLKTILALAAVQGDETAALFGNLLTNEDSSNIILEFLQNLDTNIEKLNRKRNEIESRISGTDPAPAVLETSELSKQLREIAQETTVDHHGTLIKTMAARVATNKTHKQNLKTLFQDSVSKMSSTLIKLDRDYFLNMHPDDLSSLSKPNSAKKEAAQFFNTVSTRVIDDILQFDTLAERALALDYWIQVAHQSYTNHELASINIAAAINSALEHSSIFRLNDAYACLSDSTKTMHEDLKNLLHPQKSWLAQREFQNNNPTPTIPYNGLALTDATFIIEGNPAFTNKLNGSNNHYLMQQAIHNLAQNQERVRKIEVDNPDHFIQNLGNHIKADVTELSLKSATEIKDQESEVNNRQFARSIEVQPRENNIKYPKYLQNELSQQPAIRKLLSSFSKLSPKTNLEKKNYFKTTAPLPPAKTIIIIDESTLALGHSLHKMNVPNISFKYIGDIADKPDFADYLDTSEMQDSLEGHHLNLLANPFTLHCLAKFGIDVENEEDAKRKGMSVDQITAVEDNIAEDDYNPEVDWEKLKPIFEALYPIRQVLIQEVSEPILLKTYLDNILKDPSANTLQPNNIFNEKGKDPQKPSQLIKAIAMTVQAVNHPELFQWSETDADKTTKKNNVSILNKYIEWLSLEELQNFKTFLNQQHIVSAQLPAEVNATLATQDKVPSFDHYPTMMELGAQLSKSMNDYTASGKKTGGANSPGEHGGVYKFNFYSPDPGAPQGSPAKLHTHRLLYKQDTAKQNIIRRAINKKKKTPKKPKIHHDKNIAEFMVGRMMNKLIGDDAAVIMLATKPGADVGLPDPTGENIYVGSIFVHTDYTDFFKEMGLDKRIPLAEEVHYRLLVETLSEKNADGKYVCRYENFPRIAVASLLQGNFDLHIGNFGKTPTQFDDSKKGYLRTLDFGAGLDHIENELHIHSRRRHPLGKGPLNHFLDFPRDLRVSPEFADELIRESEIDLTQTIKDSLDEISEFYGFEPILAFAKHTGMDVSDYEGTVLDADAAKENLLNDLETFLIYKMQARQASSKELGLEMQTSLCLIDLNKDNPLKPAKFEFAEVQYQIIENRQSVNKKINIDQLIKENPVYFINGDYHFRNPEHATQLFGSERLRLDTGQQQKLTKKVMDRVINHLPNLFENAYENKNPQVFEAFFLNKELQARISKKFTIENREALILKANKEYQKTIQEVIQSYKKLDTAIHTLEKSEADNAYHAFYKKVIDEILTEKNLDQRTAVLQRWIIILHSLKHDENSADLARITYEALKSPELAALTTTFESLPLSAQEALQAIEEFYVDNPVPQREPDPVQLLQARDIKEEKVIPPKPDEANVLATLYEHGCGEAAKNEAAQRAEWKTRVGPEVSAEVRLKAIIAIYDPLFQEIELLKRQTEKLGEDLQAYQLRFFTPKQTAKAEEAIPVPQPGIGD